MAAKDNRDWSKVGTVNGMADWLRKNSDAVMVIVIRAEDAVISADPLVRSQDLDGSFQAGIGEAIERMQQHEAAARLKAMLKADRSGGQKAEKQ